MKRLLCMTLCLLLTLSLFACGKAPDETTGSTAAPETDGPTTADTTIALADDSTSDPETDSQPLRLPLIAVSLPIIREDLFHDDGTLLFSHLYQDVALIAPDAEAAEQVVLNLLNQIDMGQSFSQEVRGWAEEYYDPDVDWYSYSYQLLYNPTRIDEKVLSLFGAEVAYSGGHHPNTVCVSASFDMVTGTLLTLEDVLVDGSAATELSQLIIEDLTAHKKEYQLYDGYATVVNERYGGVAANWMDQPAWYFSNVGLCVYFSPYDIAPYVSGQILVEIPYDQLTDIVKADYLPPEMPASKGTMAISLAQDLDLEQYSQFAEAILNDQGERFVLYADDLVTNVKLEQGSWSADGSVYVPTATVFMAHTLCSGDAVMVQDWIPDTMPFLRLSYESGGKTVTQYITQSGKDGSMLFIDLP